MSIVVDNTPESVEPITENLEFAAEETLDASEESTESTPVEETAVEAEPKSEIPEKYAGKTLEDVIEMHRNAEELIGKQSQEVGEQRKQIQQLLDSLPQASTTEPEEETVNFDETFYDDPQKAVSSLIENHPKFKEAERQRVQAAQEASLGKLKAEHPDFEQVINDEKFKSWVSESNARRRMYENAHNNWDFDDANELINMFKVSNMITKTKEVKEEQAKTRRKAMKSTSSETNSTGESVGSKKVYRRVDLQRLQIQDPERYAALADDIYKAYAEGRVK